LLTRSGTTLLQRIVDAHPQIASTHDQCWIARYFKKRTGLTPEGLVGRPGGKAWLGTNVRATCANFRLCTTSGPGPICPPDPGWSRRLFVDRQREQTGPYYRPPCLQRRRQGVGRGAHIRAGKVSAC